MILILLACVTVVGFLIFGPPLPQSQSYHDFADRRTILDISYFWDVISNSLFLVVGLMGLLEFRDCWLWPC
jgi:ABC-type Fe3+ transport system permease subunit